MAKFFFYNVPAAGHVNGSFPIVAELVKRGHEVVYYLSPGYRARVEATGATFRRYQAIPDDYFDRVGANGSSPPLAAAALIETSVEVLPELIADVERDRPDVIVHDAMCPWGWFLAQHTKLPSASLSSTMLFSPKMLLSTPSVWGAALGIFGSIGYLGRFRRSALVIERLYGLKVGSFLETLTSRGTVTLAYTSALFQPEASTFDRSVHFVGPMITPRHDASNFPFDHLSGDPLVYVSLGTTINNHPAFFKLCLEAFAGQPYQVVMSIGDRVAVDQLGEIPANVLIRPSVPQLEILQRARVFISHSGMNSVQESLYYGVPMLLVPQQTEQDLTANRVAELGAGIKVKLPIKPEKLLALTERLITNPTFRIRADVVGDSLLKAGGASRAADDLIALLNRSVTA